MVVLADRTKWNEVGLSTFDSLEEADVLVTDDAQPDDASIKDLKGAVRRPPKPVSVDEMNSVIVASATSDVR